MLLNDNINSRFKDARYETNPTDLWDEITAECNIRFSLYLGKIKSPSRRTSNTEYDGRRNTDIRHSGRTTKDCIWGRNAWDHRYQAKRENTGTDASLIETIDKSIASTISNEVALAASTGPVRGSCYRSGKPGHGKNECRSRHLWSSQEVAAWEQRGIASGANTQATQSIGSQKGYAPGPDDDEYIWKGV